MKKKMYIIMGIIAVVLLLAVLIVLNLTVWDTKGNYMNYITSKQYEEANNYYSKNIKGKSDKESEIANEINSYLNELISNYANNSKTYEEIKEELQKMSSLIPQPSEFENTFSKLEQLLLSKTSFESGQTLISENKYKEAITELNKVIEEDNNYVKAKDLINQATKLNKEAVIKEIQELENKKDYENAIKKAEALLTEFVNDAEVKAKLESLIKQRSSQLIEEAKQLADKKDYDNAITKLKESKTIATDTTEIDELITTYTELLPVNIVELSPISTSGIGWGNEDNLKDFYNNTYDKGIATTAFENNEDGSRFAIFDNSAKYTSIKGKLIVTTNTNNVTKNAGIFKIYGDNKLLYTKKMYQADKPANFEISIKGIEKVKIVAYAESYNSGSQSNAWVHIALVDTYFIK